MNPASAWKSTWNKQKPLSGIKTGRRFKLLKKSIY